MATAPVSARWEKCDWKLPVDCSRDPGLNVGDPASLKEFTLGTVDKKLRIVDCGNDVSRHPLAEARRGCKIRPRYARSSMDLSYIAHQTGYTRLNGPWYHLPALFLHRFQGVTLLASGRAIDSR